MRRFQKLKSSAVTLLIAVLAITCFTRGVLQLSLYIAAFVAWGIYAFISFVVPIIKRYNYRREVKRIVNEKPCKDANADNYERLSYLLLCHVNHRITGYIQSTYPDATWTWRTDKPAYIMTSWRNLLKALDLPLYFDMRRDHVPVKMKVTIYNDYDFRD